MYSLWTFFLLILSSHLLVYSQTLVNVTVDDTVSNPATDARVTYLDAGWNLCPGTFCPSLGPDVSQALNGTWRTSIFDPTREDGTSLSQPQSPPRASILFYGSAVYVYCILSFSELLNVTNSPLTKSDMVFEIDGEESGSFVLDGVTSGGSTFAYNVLVYANSSLPMDHHNLTIQNGRGIPSGTKTIMMLDYVVFTTNQSVEPRLSPPAIATSQSPDTSRSKILTGVLVTVCLLFGIVLAYLLRGVWATKIRWPKPFSKARTEVLPIPTQQNRQPFVWRWLKRYLNFSPSKPNVPFNPSLFVANRPQSQSESMKDLALPQLHGQRQSQAVLLEDELETQSKKSATEGRWAFITSWRDRTVHEAEIPSLPPTSNAPTTILSDLAPQVRPLHSHRPQQQEEAQGKQPLRGFTIMNT